MRSNYEQASNPSIFLKAQGVVFTNYKMYFTNGSNSGVRIASKCLVRTLKGAMRNMIKRDIIRRVHYVDRFLFPFKSHSQICVKVKFAQTSLFYIDFVSDLKAVISHTFQLNPDNLTYEKFWR